MVNLFNKLRSQLLMRWVGSVFLPELAKAPNPALMYWALGLLARYPTMNGVVSTVAVPAQGTPAGNPALQRGVTVLPVPGMPAGLKITRSPAVSPFKLESVPLWTVASSGDSMVQMGAISQLLSRFLFSQPPLLKYGKS